MRGGRMNRTETSTAQELRHWRSIPQESERTSLSTAWFYKGLDRLTYKRVGRRILVDPRSVDALIEGGEGQQRDEG